MEYFSQDEFFERSNICTLYYADSCLALTKKMHDECHVIGSPREHSTTMDLKFQDRKQLEPDFSVPASVEAESHRQNTPRHLQT